MSRVSEQLLSVGKKDDANKLPWNLMPWAEVEQVVQVLEHGAKKYGEYNWQYVERPRERYSAALMRHVVAYQKGETLDQESMLPHLAHAACCILFLLWIERNG